MRRKASDPVFEDPRTGGWCYETPGSTYVQCGHTSEHGARAAWHVANVRHAQAAVDAAERALTDAQTALRHATRAQELHG